MSLVTRILWWPVGFVAGNVHKAANKLVGATPVHCAFGWFILAVVARTAGIAWRFPGQLTPFDGIRLVLLFVFASNVKRIAEAREVSTTTGRVTNPYVESFRPLVGLLLVYTTAWMVLVRHGFDAALFDPFVIGSLLLDNDDDNGEPVVQRAWRRLKTLVASPTPETAMVSR